MIDILLSVFSLSSPFKLYADCISSPLSLFTLVRLWFDTLFWIPFSSVPAYLRPTLFRWYGFMRRGRTLQCSSYTICLATDALRERGLQGSYCLLQMVARFRHVCYSSSGIPSATSQNGLLLSSQRGPLSAQDEVAWRAGHLSFYNQATLGRL